MRLVALAAAALTCATLVVGAPLAAVAAPAVIGPPPVTKTQPIVVQTGLTQAEVKAELAKQKKLYDQQIADLKSQNAELETSVASKDEEIASLTSLNESIRADYTKLFEASNSQLTKLERLTAQNKKLNAAASGTRPSFARDWLDWVALVVGLLLGGIVGLRFGIRRGEDRATGSGIPENVAAWWGEPEGSGEASKPA